MSLTRSEEIELFELTEILACHDLRPRARLAKERVASGHLRMSTGFYRLVRRRLAVRSFRTISPPRYYVKIRRGDQIVRLPLA